MAALASGVTSGAFLKRGNLTICLILLRIIEVGAGEGNRTLNSLCEKSLFIAFKALTKTPFSPFCVIFRRFEPIICYYLLLSTIA
jgi:hypothetical protein